MYSVIKTKVRDSVGLIRPGFPYAGQSQKRVTRVMGPLPSVALFVERRPIVGRGLFINISNSRSPQKRETCFGIKSAIVKQCVSYTYIHEEL